LVTVLSPTILNPDKRIFRTLDGSLILSIVWCQVGRPGTTSTTLFESLGCADPDDEDDILTATDRL
jgi:hypothetical protein